MRACAPHARKLVEAIGFASLFLAAFWFRVSGLETVPEHNGDESYYGLQAERLCRGETIALQTTSGNVLNPFLLGFDVALNAFARPSLTLLRVPSVVFGLLAVVLMLTLGSRALDRTTALIAATLMMVMPVLIFESRMGLEMSQQPFFGVLTIALALLGNEVGLLLALVASLVAYPADVFLLPIVVPVYMARVYERYAGDRSQRRRVLLRCAATTLVMGTAFAFWLLRSSTAQMNLQQHDALHWRRFLDGIERLLFFLYRSGSPSAVNLHRYVFRGVLVLVLVVGLRSLWRQRQTTRLVLLLSLAATLALFHVLAGPMILRRFPTHRYGIVFVTPAIVAFACLARSFWPRAGAEPDIPSGVSLRSRMLPTAALLAVGWALLLSMKWNYFDQVAPPGSANTWTLCPGPPDPFARALAAIRDDLARSQDAAGRPAGTAAVIAPVQPIVAHDYWTTVPLRYLANGSPELSVRILIDLERLHDPNSEGHYPAHQDWLRSQFLAGAYVVEHPGIPAFLGGKVVQTVLDTAFPPGSVRAVAFIEPCLRIYKLEHPPAAPLARAPARTTR